MEITNPATTLVETLDDSVYNDTSGFMDLFIRLNHLNSPESIQPACHFRCTGTKPFTHKATLSNQMSNWSISSS